MALYGIVANVMEQNSRQLKTMSKVLQAYSSLFRNPTPICGGLLEANKGQKFRNDHYAYNRTAKEWMQKYAQLRPFEDIV